MRRGQCSGIAVGFTVFGLLVSGAVSRATVATTPAGISRQVQATLLEEARSVAKDEGDRHPYDIEAVSTTAAAAEQAECGGCEIFTQPGSTPVYLLAMRGHFSCNTCHSPPRRRGVGPGTVITLVFLAETMSRLSFGFGEHYPNLRAAGIPVRLDAAPAPHRHR